MLGTAQASWDQIPNPVQLPCPKHYDGGPAVDGCSGELDLRDESHPRSSAFKKSNVVEFLRLRLQSPGSRTLLPKQGQLVCGLSEYLLLRGSKEYGKDR